MNRENHILIFHVLRVFLLNTMSQLYGGKNFLGKGLEFSQEHIYFFVCGRESVYKYLYYETLHYQI